MSSSHTSDKYHQPNNVLIVDDKHENLRILSDMLQKNGYSVRAAINGNSALKSIKTRAPDIILLDILMPDMDGYEVCRQLKASAQTRDIPVIFISTLDNPQDKVRAFKTGGTDFIAKPFHLEEVLARIKTHITLREMNIKMEMQNSRLQEEVAKRKNAQQALQTANDTLEIRVEQRTKELENAINERLELEARFHQAQKMEAIGIMAGGIAHDFNNILFPIFGYTEMAKDSVPGNDIVQGYLDSILTGAIRAKELVQQILYLTREKKQKKRPVQVHLIINEALNLLTAVLPSTINIQKKIDKCGFVFADPGEIHQVIMNLCTNAFHAMDEQGGILELSVQEIRNCSENISSCPGMKKGRYVKVSVKDSGCGIDSKVLNRIFDPYFTTKECGKGTGLGLSVVHGIIQNCQGYINVVSKPGQGTTFFVYLPVIKSKPEPETEKIEKIIGGKEHIMIIDDEIEIIMMLEQMLKKLGYQVTALTDATKALDIFRRQPKQFDLVLTDMTMPRMTGITLAQKMLEIKPDIPLILVTGFSRLITKEKAMVIGIKEVISKPLFKREVAGVIRKTLDDIHKSGIHNLSA
ncbi:Two component system response regulator/histidine kinase [Desulfonema limicola]|uniref:histidine kinase n=1 Tax=Desulfonema limicola TaxID=45656 RepID=A0A975BDU0_9BACT|nr:response regulator [Desulfonema limicola]QTA83537.1 Two component system response regulator/histidine kinase [Desulfonema limicola]